MGGYIHLIAVEPTDELLSGMQHSKRSLLTRLFGRERASRTESTGHWPAIIELPLSKVLKRELMREFQDFVNNGISSPWIATRTFYKNYLSSMRHEVYIRGQQDKGDEPRFHYVQLSFSDCSGMAGISASLASHWAAIWAQRKREQIENKLLRPYGLEASVNPKLDLGQHEDIFLPAGEYGYASFYSSEMLESFGQVAGTIDTNGSHFAVDACWSEGLFAEGDDEAGAEPTRGVNRLLEQKYVSIMNDGRCRCQLCCPNLDVSELDQITIEDPA